MEEKRKNCTNPECKQENPQPYSAFYKSKESKDGLQCRCSECRKEYNRANAEKISESTGKYYKDHEERIKKQNNLYYVENREEILKKQRIYSKREDVKIATARNQRIKRQNDPNCRIKNNIRSRLSRVIKKYGYKKSGSSIKDLGCSVPELRDYLKSKFYSNPRTGALMGWDNYGIPKNKSEGWHIDHVIPLSYFGDLSDRKQLLKAVHYTNLQPLWAKDNLSKYNKIGDTT